MSQILSGIVGAIAVSLTFGAIQLASGSDLIAARPGTSTQGLNRSLDDANPTASAVNRTAKSDRGDWVRAAGQSLTIAIHSDGVSETSVLIRRPTEVREEARNRPPAPGSAKPSTTRRTTVACEPVVSVLTEVAKLLQPGRCVT